MVLFSLVKKDLRLLFKDRGALVVLFLLPIMFISVMSFALKPMYEDDSEKVFEVLVMDNDISKESQALVQQLQLNGTLSILTEVEGKKLTEEVLAKRVQDGDYPIGFIIPAGFAASLHEGKNIALAAYQDQAQSSVVDIIGQALKGAISSYSLSFRAANAAPDKKEIFMQIQQDMSKPIVALDLTASTNGIEAPKPNALTQNVPGYTVMFAFFIVMFAGRSFIQEKNEGTFRRILSSPISRTTLFVGKMIPNFLLGLIQVLLLFTIGYVVFGMQLGSSIGGLIFVSIALVWASTCMAMMIAALFKTEAQISGASVMIILTLAALGGTMVPLFVMPDVMQTIALITPMHGH